MAKGFISAEMQVSAAAEALEGTAAGLPKIQRKVLQAAAKGTRQKIVAGIRRTTKRRTGELLKAYRYKLRKDGSQVNIFPRKATKDSRIFPKAYTLNYGVPGKGWKARGFVEEGERYAESNEWMAQVDKAVQKELDSYWG